MGSDDHLVHVQIFPGSISIHAPAWGATIVTESPPPSVKSFQSTLPRGERRLYDTMQILNIRFQSTLPRGERRSLASAAAGASEFQSTLPRGERPGTFCRAAVPNRISIHAPAWGAPHPPGQRQSRFPYFNPRSRVGSDDAA